MLDEKQKQFILKFNSLGDAILLINKKRKQSGERLLDTTEFKEISDYYRAFKRD
jgi:hypothetical protein